MAQPGDFAYTVKQQADIVRIVGEYVTLKKAGAQNWSGLCPFHKEKTGSFSVHATRQFYHCFGCGASGDVFKFVQKIENITFPEAVRSIAQKLGIALPKIEYSSPEEARQARQRGALLDIHERACAWFEEQLRKPDGAGAREYLKSRGLSDDIIKRFRIGFAPDHGFALRDVVKNQFDEEIMRASGLFSWKENTGSFDSRQSRQHPFDSTQGSALRAPVAQDDKVAGAPLAMYSKFRNRIMFPICNEQGRVIAFTGRTLAQDEKAGPKYLNSPETPIYSKSHVLFNLDKAKDAIRKMEYAILVEGQMDCISVFAAGVPNVIASSGTAFTEPQARLLARFSRNIIVNFDPDTAGANAAERSLGLLVEEDFQIKVLTLDAGFDPDLFIRDKGREAYIAALRSAPKYFDYLIARAQAQFPVRTTEGKVKAVNFLLPHIQRLQSRIERDEWAGNIAQRLGIDSAVLRQELKSAATNRTAAHLKTYSALNRAEKIFLIAVAGGPPILHFDPDIARDHLRRTRLHGRTSISSVVDALIEADGDLIAAALKDPERALVAEVLLKRNEELAVTLELFEQICSGVLRGELLSQQRDLQEQMKSAKRINDTAAVEQLRRQKIELDRRIRELGGTASASPA